MSSQSESSRATLADMLLDAGKRAFDPSSDQGAREDALGEFRRLIDGNGSWDLLPALNALIKPNVAPPQLQPELMNVLTRIPLRPDGVRGTLEFVFSVHPSSNSKASDEAATQKRGANITQEALAVATRILTAPPTSVPPETWFAAIAPQVFHLLDGLEGPELSKAAAQIIMLGILGRRQFGAPGTPGWAYFAEPLLRSINPSRDRLLDDGMGSNDASEVIDFTRDKVLVTADGLHRSLARLSILINSTPYPAQTRRLLDPIIPQLWAISSWPEPNAQCQERFIKPASSLLHTFFRIAASCTSDDVSTFFLNLLGRWLTRASEHAKAESEVVTQVVEQSDSDQRLEELLEVTVLHKLLEKIPKKLIGRIEQVLELVCRILDPGTLATQPDDIVAVGLSLLNLILTSPVFRKSNLKPQGVQVLEQGLDSLGKQDRPEVSTTARNLLFLLQYRDAADEGERDAFIPTNSQIEDRNTYKLAISPALDIQAVLVLLSSLLQDSEDFINLRVIKVFTQLANKHPKATVKEILEHYLDPEEAASTDLRLRFGEALLQVVERLGETFAGDVARQTVETLLSIAGRRGYRPKTEARQVRATRLREMKKKDAEEAWGGEVPDLGDEVPEDEKERNDILAQIVEGWESRRGSEDVRMRSSALSILAGGIETNVSGVGAELVSASVDLCINVLTLEPEIGKGILRRAAVMLVLSFVRALDKAKQTGRRIGFGLTDQSREDITRVLKYVVVMDNDGLVQQHARDVIESLDSWKIASVLPPEGMGQQSTGLERLSGLTLSPGHLGSSLQGTRTRPRIEEIE
ncbi:hypothetical protein ACRALDRAFT_1074174 [Sodiomyces alcalophilus JCM 7366]|uniref:uncharacterized protein n=1 Tax=Sodiomyces alcalophilus JCM 7366 TaxID=591952 RepID=UPI0039B3EAB2